MEAAHLHLHQVKYSGNNVGRKRAGRMKCGGGRPWLLPLPPKTVAMSNLGPARGGGETQKPGCITCGTIPGQS